MQKEKASRTIQSLIDQVKHKTEMPPYEMFESLITEVQIEVNKIFGSTSRYTEAIENCKPDFVSYHTEEPVGTRSWKSARDNLLNVLEHMFLEITIYGVPPKVHSKAEMSNDAGSPNNLVDFIKAKCDSDANKYARRILWLYIGLIVIVWSILAYLTMQFGWDKMEPWTYFIGLGALIVSYAFFAIYNHEWTPKSIVEHIYEEKKKKYHEEYGIASYSRNGPCASK